MANFHFDLNPMNGGVLGSVLSPMCAMLFGFLKTETLIQTAVCGAIGAGAGFIITYLLKLGFNWLERKLKYKPPTS